MRSLMELLDETEEKYHYIPEEMVSGIAEYLGISKSEIYGVIQNIDRFNEKPVSKYTIRVCNGQVCGHMGSDGIYDSLKEIVQGSNGLIAVEMTGCVGACSQAPVLTVNDEIRGEMTADKLNELIRSISD